nr:gas vesicle protein GvpH [Halorubellus sp. JP-L1]
MLAIRRYTDRVHAERSTGVRQSRRSRDGRPSVSTNRERRRDVDGVAEPERSRRIAGDGGSPRFTVREIDTGLLVVADLKGVVRDDQQTEIDLSDDGLILTVDNRFAWRVPVEDGHSSITDVSLNNDVLEARVDVGD